ncbi:MAG: hypothetical protein HC900_00155 [Methylacidiphilales bacterium]|nr:hypothetical protein [Candidatus Methylacidiphilales bacterium]
MSEVPYTFDDWQSGARPPKGWDAADACDDGWTKDQIDTFVWALLRPWVRPGAESDAAGGLDSEAASASAEPEPEPTPVASPEPPRPIPAGLVREARTTQQEQPQQRVATVTDISTRKTYSADEAWRCDLIPNEDYDTKVSSQKNWALYLEHHHEMRGVLRFNAFTNTVMVHDRPPWVGGLAEWRPRPIKDGDYAEMVVWLEGKYFTPKVASIAPIANLVADHNTYDPLREFLDGLAWDRKPRVETWMTYYLGAEDTLYTRAVAKRSLVAAAARALRPGCKCDTMTILEGPQGRRKSSAIRALFGDDFFTDELSDVGSKDASMELQGIWGLEVAEMHRFNASETNAVKKFLSKQEDRYRPTYGRTVVRAPRRVVIWGTINPDGNPYLRDPTGARRFWPVQVGQRIDLDALAEDREQLWAEAVTMFRAGVSWWMQQEDMEAVEAEQGRRTDIDVWTETIAPHVSGLPNVKLTDVMAELAIPKKEQDRRHVERIGRIMKRLGYEADRKGDHTIFRRAPRPAEQPEW